MFFLVLPGLVKRFLWDPLVRALQVPVRLPCLVWISSGRGSTVVRRSSQSHRGFGLSLSPSLGRVLGKYKASYPPLFAASYLMISSLLS